MRKNCRVMAAWWPANRLARETKFVGLFVSLAIFYISTTPIVFYNSFIFYAAPHVWNLIVNGRMGSVFAGDSHVVQ